MLFASTVAAEVNVGGPLIREASDDLREAQAIRERLGKYAPNEEAQERAKLKFRRALSKIKVMRTASGMLDSIRDNRQSQRKSAKRKLRGRRKTKQNLTKSAEFGAF